MGAPAKNKHLPLGLQIVYEDPTLIVVDKEAGLLTIGTERESVNTLYYRLTDWVRKGNYKSRNRVFIVHRLDRETSGLLVLAKTPEAKAYLQDNWDQTTKKYHAVVHGNLSKPEGTFSSYLTENTAHVVHSTRDKTVGKLSHTKYRVLKDFDGHSLIELELLTGRKHQIRVHLAEAGHPILGDTKYGGEKLPGKQIALHACSLDFIHPHTRQPMHFEAPDPRHIQRLLRATLTPPAAPPSQPQRPRHTPKGKRS